VVTRGVTSQHSSKATTGCARCMVEVSGAAKMPVLCQQIRESTCVSNMMGVSCACEQAATREHWSIQPRCSVSDIPGHMENGAVTTGAKSTYKEAQGSALGMVEVSDAFSKHVRNRHKDPQGTVWRMGEASAALSRAATKQHKEESGCAKGMVEASDATRKAVKSYQRVPQASVSGMVGAEGASNLAATNKHWGSLGYA